MQMLRPKSRSWIGCLKQGCADRVIQASWLATDKRARRRKDASGGLWADPREHQPLVLL